MKIVQINTECERGSTGKIVRSISEALSEKNIENYIFYSGNHTSTFERGIRVNSKNEIRIHQFLSRLFGDQGCHSYFTTKKLIRSLG